MDDANNIKCMSDRLFQGMCVFVGHETREGILREKEEILKGIGKR